MIPAQESYGSIRARATNPTFELAYWRQTGPRRVWDAVERAVLTWREAGSPTQSDFGLTITPQGQWAWLDDPNGPHWALPTTPT